MTALAMRPAGLETVRLDEGLQRTTAPNGLVVLTEHLAGVRSAAVGIWVRTASAHEPPAQMGISHLLEHMVFKATERRSARQLALELEVRGGSLDAFTGRDYTSYQAHVLDADLPLAVEILTDLVRRPLLRESDLLPERNVILEEINGVQDTPDDVVFEIHSAALWGDHPYGYSILGTPETIEGISAEDLRTLHTTGYARGNCVIAAAGNVNHEQLLTVLEREGWFQGQRREFVRRAEPTEAAVRGREVREVRDTAQTHIVLGTDTFPLRDPRRFPLALLINVLGGGMSSRLFQHVREELGLAYAVYAYKSFYQCAGQLGIYVGTQPATADRALEAIRHELQVMAREGLSAQELQDAKQQLKGQIMLALESPGSRMGRLAGFTLHGDRYRPLDEVLADISAIGRDEVAAVAHEFFQPERQTVVRLGPDGQ
ncbi:MAG TPA: pitrilysin family protein [Gemmatimonadales bacterium]|nr:pitrilysin family protein [Gemmatimonadales bacterium]